MRPGGLGLRLWRLRSRRARQLLHAREHGAQLRAQRQLVGRDEDRDRFRRIAGRRRIVEEQRRDVGGQRLRDLREIVDRDVDLAALDLSHVPIRVAHLLGQLVLRPVPQFPQTPHVSADPLPHRLGLFHRIRNYWTCSWFRPHRIHAITRI